MEDLKKFQAEKVVVVPWGHRKDLSSRVYFCQPFGNHHINLVDGSGGFKSVLFVGFECGMEFAKRSAEMLAAELGLPVEIDIDFYLRVPEAKKDLPLAEFLQVGSKVKEKELVMV